MGANFIVFGSLLVQWIAVCSVTHVAFLSVPLICCAIMEPVEVDDVNMESVAINQRYREQWISASYHRAHVRENPPNKSKPRTRVRPRKPRTRVRPRIPWRMRLTKKCQIWKTG